MQYYQLNFPSSISRFFPIKYYLGTVEVNVQSLMTETVFVKNELDSLRFDMASVKAEATGVNVFVTSMQNHISGLTTNLTNVSDNLTTVAGNKTLLVVSQIF